MFAVSSRAARVHRARPLALLAALAPGALLVGCGGEVKSGQGPAVPAEEVPVAVQVAPVRREPMAALYATSATLRAERQATVASRTHGVLRALLVEEGDAVEAEQELARLEDVEQRIEFERAQSVLATEERELARAEKLHKERSLSENDLETARQELAEAKHRAALAELNLSRTVIRAPFAGRILRRQLDVGATVSDGTALFELADCEPLCADVAVPERHVARLAVGQPVRLLADATATTLEARIERVAPGVDPATGTVKVTLSVTSRNDVRPGSFARVGIVTEQHPDALIVPRSALVPEGRRWHVFRLAGDVVEQVEVTLGFEEGDRVELLPPGAGAPFLEPGQQVVVVGAAALSPGRKVMVPAAPGSGAVEARSTAAATSSARG